MSATEVWALDYVMNSLWQAPVIFLAAWLAVRMARQIGARAEHRIWVSALLMEAAIPACGQHLSEWIRGGWMALHHGWSGGAAGGQVRVAMGAATAVESGVLRLPYEVKLGVVLLYGCSLLYFAVRLGWGLWRTRMMRKEAEPVVLTGDAALSWMRYGRLLGVDAAGVAVSRMVSGPVTVGVRRGVMIVSPEFLKSVGESDLDAVVAHELAHMRRRDFAKNVLYELVSLPVAFHPMVWLTRSRVAESREMVCDAMAAEAVGGRESYARALLRLASMIATGTPARTLHAIGIFDANIFERRVMNLTKRRVNVSGVRRFGIVAACVVVGLATCASALALRMEVSAPATAEQSAGAPTPKVGSGMMAKQVISQTPPIYPAQAKADKISGAVVLSLVINKDGEPTNIHVRKSVRKDLDDSAVTAVSQWRWKPYRLNGEDVAVETTVTVNYNLVQ